MSKIPKGRPPKADNSGELQWEVDAQTGRITAHRRRPLSDAEVQAARAPSGSETWDALSATPAASRAPSMPANLGPEVQRKAWVVYEMSLLLRRRDAIEEYAQATQNQALTAMLVNCKNALGRVGRYLTSDDLRGVLTTLQAVSVLGTLAQRDLDARGRGPMTEPVPDEEMPNEQALEIAKRAYERAVAKPTKRMKLKRDKPEEPTPPKKLTVRDRRRLNNER